MRALCATLAALLASSVAQAASSAAPCRQDLEAIPAFLLANDAGARDELDRAGQGHFDAALAQAQQAVERIGDDAQCLRALNDYLKAWRKGHLRVNATGPQSATALPVAARAPHLEVLSGQTVVLSLPSFGDADRAALRALLRQQHHVLDAHRYWIIDVRGNSGGSDDVFYPLLPALMSNGYERVGAAWLATPANIETQRSTCALFAPGDPACLRFMDEAVQRMSSVPPGTLVSQEDGPAIRYVEAERDAHHPTRAAVLMDGGCGSTCEEFLLTVRQSFTVKLVGAPSAGSLDYSNVRPHPLPSGKRVLMYATSRSYRLPGLPVDAAGVQPDIYLPEITARTSRGADASDPLIVRVQRWLEGGSLEGGSAK